MSWRSGHFPQPEPPAPARQRRSQSHAAAGAAARGCGQRGAEARPPQRFDPGPGQVAPAGGAGQPPGVSAPRGSARAPAGRGRGAHCEETAAQPPPPGSRSHTAVGTDCSAAAARHVGKEAERAQERKDFTADAAPPRPREIAPSPGAGMLGRGRVSSQPLVAVPGWEVGARSSDVSASETPEIRVWWDSRRWLGCLFQLVSEW